MKKIIIHIGTYKTGSSALQRLLAHNIQPLLQQGYNYLPVGPAKRPGKNTKVGNVQFLGMAYWEAEQLYNLQAAQGALLGEFLQALDQCGDCIPIISGESFCDITKVKLDSFFKLLRKRGYEPHLLLFIRDQASYVESRYNQFVRKNRPSIKDFQYYATQWYKTVDHLHYDTFADMLASLVGQDKLKIVAFGEKDIYETVADYLNIDLAVMQIPDKTINLGIPLDKMRIMSKLNPLNPPPTFTYLMEENEALFQAEQKPIKRSLITPELDTSIANYFAEENKKCANKWFNRDHLFTVKPRNWIREKDIEKELNLNTIIEMYGGLLVNQDSRLSRIENILLKAQSKLK